MIGALVAGITGAGGAVASSYESIATATGTGSSGTISFTTIPSGFKHLEIRAIVSDVSEYSPNLQFNSDTGNNYAIHQLYGDGTSAAAAGTANFNKINLGSGARGTNNVAAFVCQILDYSSTSKNKTVRSFTGWDSNNTYPGYVGIHSGVWLSTSAVTRIDVIMGGNFSTQTQIALYGIKEA